MVSDTDGSAFITKAEFDSLKNNFQAQIDNYNSSIDSKIDGAIASYLAGVRLSSTTSLSPIVPCSSTTPYRIVGHDYDTRTDPILPSFSFVAFRTHDWGGAYARPIAHSGYSYAGSLSGDVWTNTEDPSYSGSTPPTVNQWGNYAIEKLASYMSTWFERNNNICFLTSDSNPQVIKKKINEQLQIGGFISVFENGYAGIGCAHGYMFSRKLFNNIDLSTRIEKYDLCYRGLDTNSKWFASDILDYFEDAKLFNANGATKSSDPVVPMPVNLSNWWNSDTINDWSATRPSYNEYYCVQSVGMTDINTFTLNFTKSELSHPDQNLNYSYLMCGSSRLYLHAESETTMQCFTDEVADTNGMKSLYTYTSQDDRLFKPVLWGATIKESEITTYPTYDTSKWPRIKMKQDSAVSTNLKDFYNGAFTYTDSTGNEKNVHFYGGYPLFVADKEYKKVTITLTEKKGTATGSNGRVWLKKGEFLNESDLSASPWTAAERNNLYKINGTAGTSSTNYGHDITFDTPTQVVINDIAAGDEVFLRFSDSSNGTGCLIDSIQIEAELEN